MQRNAGFIRQEHIAIAKKIFRKEKTKSGRRRSTALPRMESDFGNRYNSAQTAQNFLTPSIIQRFCRLKSAFLNASAVFDSSARRLIRQNRKDTCKVQARVPLPFSRSQPHSN